MSTVVGLVLAAGAARRMGRPKQLLPLGGRALLQHVVDAAAASALGDVVIVLGHEADAIEAALRLPARARVVRNPDHAEGQSTSLRHGLAAAPADATAAAVLLGDQPGIGPAVIDAVLAGFATAGTAAVRPVWRGADGRAHPGHPVVLGRALWPAVAELRGDRGARALFERHPEWVTPVAMAGEPPADVDDDEDYRRACEAFDTDTATTGG